MGHVRKIGLYVSVLVAVLGLGQFVGVQAASADGPMFYSDGCPAGYFCILAPQVPGDNQNGYKWYGADSNYADNYTYEVGTIDNKGEWWENNGNHDNVCVFQYASYGGAWKFIPRGSGWVNLDTVAFPGGGSWLYRPSSHYWVSGTSC